MGFHRVISQAGNFFATNFTNYTNFKIIREIRVIRSLEQLQSYKGINPRPADIYPDFAHESLPGHNDRIFQFLSQLA